MKYINFKRYKFFTIKKNINNIRNNLIKTFKFTNYRSYGIKKINTYLDFKRYKYLDLKRYSYKKIFRNLSAFKIRKKYQLLPIYFLGISTLVGFLYISIPSFYNYNINNIEKSICDNKNIKCIIKDNVKYKFYPTPRIIIKNLIVKDTSKKQNTILTSRTIIKFPISKLFNIKKIKPKKIEFNNFELNLNLKNLNKYSFIFNQKISLIPLLFRNGKITLLDENNYVSTIDSAYLNIKNKKETSNLIIKGNFLNVKIYISLEKEKIDKKILSKISLKMPTLKLLTEINFFNLEKNKSIEDGKILIRKGKNKITAIFDFKDNEIKINNSNIRNAFLDGKLIGKITLLPYFNFDLSAELSSLSFTKLYSHFLELDEKKRYKIFKINKKINGKLNLSADKIYSDYNLIKSFESRLEFNNGDVFVDQFLINLGKLGAADLLGTITNDDKYTNFKFESNIFVENQKKFISKFSLYNKEKISPSLFVSGNLDLINLKCSFYEISTLDKLNKDDVNYIEKEFNSIMLDNGYETLFLFSNFKEFIKSISSEVN